MKRHRIDDYFEKLSPEERGDPVKRVKNTQLSPGGSSDNYQENCSSSEAADKKLFLPETWTIEWEDGSLSQMRPSSFAQVRYTLTQDQLMGQIAKWLHSTHLEGTEVGSERSLEMLLDQLVPHEQTPHQIPLCQLHQKHARQRWSLPLHFERIFRALLFVPRFSYRNLSPLTTSEEVLELYSSKGHYRHFSLKIAPSTLGEHAGSGVFAMEDLPTGVLADYRGQMCRLEHSNDLYSWALGATDPTNGAVYTQPPKERDVGCVDATDLRYCNWTRFVNCGNTPEQNNLVVRQFHYRMQYVTLRDIRAGEELFIDYGSVHRQRYLSLQYKPRSS